MYGVKKLKSSLLVAKLIARSDKQLKWGLLFCLILTGQYVAGANISYIYPDGELIARQVDYGNLQSYITDQKGSVLKLSSNTQNQQGVDDQYDAYGMPQKQPDLNAQEIPNPFMYNGEWYDNFSQLQYLRARFYSSSLMRFTQQDSYDLLNRFAYGDGNPILNNDPSWHISFGGLMTDIGFSAQIAVGLVTGDPIELGLGIAGIVSTFGVIHNDAANRAINVGNIVYVGAKATIGGVVGLQKVIEQPQLEKIALNATSAQANGLIFNFGDVGSRNAVFLPAGGNPIQITVASEKKWCGIISYYRAESMGINSHTLRQINQLIDAERVNNVRIKAIGVIPDRWDRAGFNSILRSRKISGLTNDHFSGIYTRRELMKAWIKVGDLNIRDIFPNNQMAMGQVENNFDISNLTYQLFLT